MLSAVIVIADAAVRVSPYPDAIVRTLSSLVPAAMEGIVRDVVLAAPLPDEDNRRIADHAGCVLVEAGTPASVIGAGIARTRSDIVLVMRAGDAPGPGFFEEVSDLSGRLGVLGAVQARSAPETFLTRLLPALSRPAALVAVRRALPASAAHLEALIRAARPKETLRARLRRVG